jgi:hypothetical protein
MLILESSYALPQTLEYHEVLNPAIWDADEQMKDDVRHALLRVADNFIETLKPTIDESMIEDICLTGSNANYNYTTGSDCDVHIMIRFPEKIYEDYALAKKTVWNNQYHVSIHGFPAEIYPQDAKEKIVDGSGWYSITKAQWIQKPVHQENVDVTNPAIIQVANKIGKQIEFVTKYNVSDLKTLHHLGTKIWGLRDQAKRGEFSINNLAFKELRNNGLTDKYIKHMQEIQSKQLTLD